MSLESIKDKILRGECRFSEHAIKRMIKRSIERFEVEEAIISGEAIEEYPEDKYSPSCLIYGKTKSGLIVKSGGNLWTNVFSAAEKW